jgi:serine/threonine-protein kinase HipA
MLAEGSAKTIQCKAFRIDENDLFTRLLKTTQSNTIGSITIKEVGNNEDKL